MPKSISILLLLCLLPVIGTAQSTRKLNKQLKAAYAVKYHHADSIRQLHEKELALWEATKNTFYDTIYGFRAMNRKYETLADSVNHKRINLERLGVEKVKGVDHEYLYAFFHKSQEAEFIFSPFFDRLGFLDAVLGSGVYLDSVIDLELYNLDFQNDYLQRELESIDRFYTVVGYDRKMITESLLKMDTAQMQLTALKQTLKEMMPTLRAYNLILEKELTAKKQLFAKNGPKGFDEAYFNVFPDVFPKQKVEPLKVDIETIERTYDGEPNEAPPPVPVNVSEELIYQYVDEPAAYPGGEAKLREFVSANLHYPELARELGIAGKCFLQFVVDKTGKISNIKILRGVPDCKECDKEAVQMVKSMPDWIPAKVNGKPVNSLFNLPVSFKLTYK